MQMEIQPMEVKADLIVGYFTCMLATLRLWL